MKKGSFILIKAFICALFFLRALFAGAVPFEGTKFVISGPSPHSPPLAKKIYRQGGNIADMAVAAALALAVTHPYYVSLGCGGFALVKAGDSVEALDFRETAPYNMPSDFFEKTGLSSRKGGPSAGVPGFLAGLAELHKKHGKLPWAKLVRPAILLAEKGFPVSGDFVRLTKKSKDKFNPAGKKIFFKKSGEPYQPNELFKQARLAGALRLIQKKGPKAFYKGPVGGDLVSSAQAEKGLIAKEDLAKYRARWLKPVIASFRGYEVYSMPLPSSGGIILSRALKLIERQKLYRKELYSADELHLLAEIMDRAFLPRFLMGDPDFSRHRTEDWLSVKNLEDTNKTIFLRKAMRLPPLKEEPAETTHISLIDSEGRAVAMTLTLNGFYGSHVVSSKYGIVLNNQMDDFTTLPGQANMFGLIQGESNSIQGGKRPLSSMTPSIVEKKGEAVLAIGGAGGPAIITAVLQTLYRHLINKMDLESAIQSPRLHDQFLPRKLFIESKRFNPELIVELRMRGHKIQFKDYIAQVFAVGRDYPHGLVYGAGETRRESAAGGL